ncbi:MAG TPA: hypothetical protein PKA74_14905 [Bauldia sp.]|nr:hypothetical protein [Bauldia sp.]
MRTRLFQIFRQRDGRSLGRAMAFLIALHALVLGLDSGTMAAAAGAGAICSTDGAASLPGTPVHHQDTECCLTGCAAPAMAAPPAVDLPAPPAFTVVADPAPPAASVVARRIDAASPRGPPRAA